MRRLVQEGPYPWWTPPELNLSFWRPLSSALAALDHRLFGRDALGHHFHSLVWYLGVVALFGALLRRLFSRALAVVALLLFAGRAGGALGVEAGESARVGGVGPGRAGVAGVPAAHRLARPLRGGAPALPLALRRRGAVPAPRGLQRWVLSMVQESPIVTRTGPASLTLELPHQGHFFTSDLELSLRSPEYMLGEGAQVKLEGMTVTVLTADTQGPTRLGFEFDTALEDPSLVFMHWREGGLRRLVPPTEGTRLELSTL